MAKKKRGRGGPGKLDPWMEKNKRKAEQRAPQERSTSDMPTDSEGFNNPYTFVPTPPRNLEHFFASDHDPSHPDHEENHSRLWEKRYTGTIPVKMTVQTPLFLTKTPHVREDVNGHKTYDCLEHVPATAIKGMLRSAYEVITNSRFGVLNQDQSGKWVGFRRPTSFAQKLKPAIVVASKDSEGSLALKILTGPIKLARYNTRSNSNDRGAGNAGLKYEGGGLPRHGDKVRVKASGDKATVIRKFDQEGGGDVGYVFVTGPTIKNKAKERVFLENGSAPVPIPNHVRNRYNALIADYKSIHERDLEKRKRDNEKPWDYLGDEPGKTAWAPYIYDKSWGDLKINDLVYVWKTDANSIAGLYPALIPRDLYNKTPLESIDDSLLPALYMNNLSPAERLFGWVNSKGKGAWRGKLRIANIAPPSHADGEPIERFPTEEPLPLAILAAPKVSQTRFYLGNKNGDPPRSGLPKNDLQYDGKRCIRGRKLYWTPKMIASGSGYWAKPYEDRTDRPESDYWQEYRQPPGRSEKTDQNRSITGWYKPGGMICFELRFENLTIEELGALVTLVQLEEGAYLRLGLGKPLGLGCVRLSLDEDGGTTARIQTGTDWANRYKKLIAAPPSQSLNLDEAVSAYKTAIREAYGQDTWAEIPFIKAFLRACVGPANDMPVHYPRTDEKRKRGEEIVPSFEWFVQNERIEGGNVAGIPLPSATDGAPLPYDPGAMRPRNDRGGHGGNGGRHRDNRGGRRENHGGRR